MQKNRWARRASDTAIVLKPGETCLIHLGIRKKGLQEVFVSYRNGRVSLHATNGSHGGTFKKVFVGGRGRRDLQVTWMLMDDKPTVGGPRRR